MAEYIEREAIMEFPIRKDHCDKERANEHFIFGIESVLEYVENLPAADVAPVVHGRWIEQEDPMLDVYYTCSVCKEDFYIETTGYTEKDMFLYTYCPNCGARMDGGNENDR